jgi:hypothetical protein
LFFRTCPHIKVNKSRLFVVCFSNKFSGGCVWFARAYFIFEKNGGLAGCKPAVQMLTPGDVAGCKPASLPTHRKNVPHSWQRRGNEENHGFASNARLRDLMPCKSTCRCAKKAWWNSGQPAKTSQVVAMEIQAADSKRLRGKNTRTLYTIGLVHENGKI